MKDGIRLFKIFGIEITLDFSWFIIFFLVTWNLASGYFPFMYPFFGKGTNWIIGTFSSLLLFATVLLHELSHSVVANMNGLNIKGIKLFVFGGVAQLSQEPQTARVEFDIAIAGPICSFILHFIFKWLAFVLASVMPMGIHNPITAVCSYLAMINMLLGVINLIPAYPLDGGRVLRAFIWSRTNNLRTATSVASMVGKVFAVFIIFEGFMEVMHGDASGLWYVFIGMFLFWAAKSGYEQILVRDLLNAAYVRNVMSSNVIAIDANTTLDEAVESYFLKYHHSSFPVCNGGDVKGMLGISRVKEISRDKWMSTKVIECMEKIQKINIISPYEKTVNILNRFVENELDHLLVMDGEKLVGIVTRVDIMKLLKVKMDLGK